MKLRALHTELQQAHATKSSISTSLKELMNIIESLEPSSVSYSTSEHDGMLDVCPDYFPAKYQGTKSGYPFFHFGWITEKCKNVKPFKDVITILINLVDHPDRDQKYVPTVFKGINDSYPMLQVLIAARKGSELKKSVRKYTNMKVIEMEVKTTSGKAWNILVASARTPYVLIGRDLSHFSWLVQLERQIRVISSIPQVKVAGGSFRNTTGHWQVGCYQTKLLNYVLEYKDGYFHSRNECMFCDHLVGPFVAKTKLVKRVKFDEGLTSEVFMEDWFLRVSGQKHQIMNCPDAMYFTADDYNFGVHAKIANKHVWLPLAKKWTLNRIVLPHSVIHKYSCGDIGYKCDTGVTDTIALPVCCSELQAAAIAFFHDYCKKHNLVYELDTGTVVSAAKLGTMLPWEKDGDLILGPENLTLFLDSDNQKKFQNAGFSLSGFEHPVKDAKGQWKSTGFFYLKPGPLLYIEVWGFSKMSNNFLPREVRDIETKMMYGGRWVIGPYSPGLYVRNRYGHEVYKHSQHWTVVGLPNSFSVYNPGSFKKCKTPGFHGCLDRLPADGNIPWLVP